MKKIIGVNCKVLFIVIFIVFIGCKGANSVTWKVPINKQGFKKNAENYVQTFSTIYFKYPKQSPNNSVNVYISFKEITTEEIKRLKFYMKYKEKTYNIKCHVFSKYYNDDNESVFLLEILDDTLKNEVIEPYLTMFTTHKKEDLIKEFQNIIINSSFFFVDENNEEYPLPYLEKTDFYIHVNTDTKYKNIITL